MKTPTLFGLAAVAATCTVVWAAWGGGAVAGAAAFGGLAAGIHVAAVALLRPALVRPYDRLIRQWAAGVALRLAGVAILGAGLIAAPDRLAPLPTAVGFLGVLVPSLGHEMWLILRSLKDR